MIVELTQQEANRINQALEFINRKGEVGLADSQASLVILTKLQQAAEKPTESQVVDSPEE